MRQHHGEIRPYVLDFWVKKCRCSSDTNHPLDEDTRSCLSELLGQELLPRTLRTFISLRIHKSYNVPVSII